MIIGEYEKPTATGKVYITMKSNVCAKPRLYVKRYKCSDGWLLVTDENSDMSNCWAFSKQSAKKIIENLKKEYKINYEKDLIEFGTIEQYE